MFHFTPSRKFERWRVALHTKSRSIPQQGFVSSDIRLLNLKMSRTMKVINSISSLKVKKERRKNRASQHVRTCCVWAHQAFFPFKKSKKFTRYQLGAAWCFVWSTIIGVQYPKLTKKQILTRSTRNFASVMKSNALLALLLHIQASAEQVVKCKISILST